METVAGVFNSSADAERAIQGLRSAGIAEDRISFLTPGTTDQAVEAAVPTTETEQPGMGTAMGGTVGGAMGVAGGASLGAAAASLLIPGVGPVIAGGIIGAALLEELFLDSDELLDAAVSDRQSFERVGFGDFERASLDHHDRVLRGGEDDVHVAVRELLESRVEDPVLLDATDANASDRTHERDLRGV